jgi:hypothetical protein
LHVQQLQSVGWRLNIQLASSDQSKMKIPNALFELRLADGNKVCCCVFCTRVCLHYIGCVFYGEQPRENVHIELTHAELFELYQKVRINTVPSAIHL